MSELPEVHEILMHYWRWVAVIIAVQVTLDSLGIWWLVHQH